MAHVHGHPDNEAENLDDILGRGLGDPDVWGYPGDEKLEASLYPKVHNKNKNKNATTLVQTNRTSILTGNQKCIGQKS